MTVSMPKPLPSPLPEDDKDLPLTRLLPNMLTLMSLCSGLTGIRYALLDRWDHAALAIVIAGVFDLLDGRVARMLRIASKFGAELDSLSDAISFGVAPGLIMYEWTLKDDAGIGWIAVLVLSVCNVLRLARFNTMIENEPPPPWGKGYFTGIPAPGGAGLVLMPLFLFLAFGPDAQWNKYLIAGWLVVVAGLMISRVPTLALKGWRVSPKLVPLIFVIAVLLMASMITNPWLTLSGISSFYLLTLPVGWLMHHRLRRKYGV